MECHKKNPTKLNKITLIHNNLVVSLSTGNLSKSDAHLLGNGYSQLNLYISV